MISIIQHFKVTAPKAASPGTSFVSERESFWFFGNRFIIPNVPHIREALFYLFHDAFGADKSYATLITGPICKNIWKKHMCHLIQSVNTTNHALRSHNSQDTWCIILLCTRSTYLGAGWFFLRLRRQPGNPKFEDFLPLMFIYAAV